MRVTSIALLSKANGKQIGAVPKCERGMQMSRHSIVTFLSAMVLSVFASAGRAEGLLPIERQVREQFPSVALESQSTLEPAQELIAGRMVSGLRARALASAPQAHHPLQPQELSTLPADHHGVSVRVFYPASYDAASWWSSASSAWCCARSVCISLKPRPRPENSSIRVLMTASM